MSHLRKTNWIVAWGGLLAIPLLIISGDISSASARTVSTKHLSDPALLRPDYQGDPGANQSPSFLDFGDAPDPSYPTLLTNNGARHALSGPRLGSGRDGETNGQPNGGATGDGADEDGVRFLPLELGPILIPCKQKTLEVTTTTSGNLDAWIDYNDDGDWTDTGEKLFATSQAVPSGTSTITISVPCVSQALETYARFRLSSTGGLAIAGLATDGEVEDYSVQLRFIDYGDNPSVNPDDVNESWSYHTTISDNGARHFQPTATPLGGALHLGIPYGPTDLDFEMDGMPSANARGDDNTDEADENGIRIPLQNLTNCAMATIQVGMRGDSNIDGRLRAWMDVNRDGDWDDTDSTSHAELIIDELLNPVNTLFQNLDFLVPCLEPLDVGDAKAPSYMRFRVSTEEGLDYQGEAIDGEVEDFLVTFAPRYDLCQQSSADEHVIALHGFAGESVPNCEGSYDRLVDDFESFGWDRDKIHLVSWQTGAIACTEFIGNFPTSDPNVPVVLDSNVSMHDVAFRLAEYINEEFTSQNEEVDVVAHSAAGLLIRYAVEYAYTERARRPLLPEHSFPAIKVEDVFTIAAPHGGIDFGGWLPEASIWIACRFAHGNSQQCIDQKRDAETSRFSRFLYRQSWFTRSERNVAMGKPQFTVVGDYYESQIGIPGAAVHWNSAIDMPGARFKAVYQRSDHRHHHSNDDSMKKGPQPPLHAEVAYLYDSGCSNDHIMWLKGYCKPDDVDYGTIRCRKNLVANPDDKRIGPFGGFCKWINQPHTLWHASLALSRSDW